MTGDDMNLMCLGVRRVSLLLKERRTMKESFPYRIFLVQSKCL